VPILGAVFVQEKLLELDLRRASERRNIHWGNARPMRRKEVEPAA
jgi:hypothetical protein